MFIPKPDLQGADLEESFSWANSVFDRLRNDFKSEKNSWDILSMGMSGDYEKALKFGSTHVRLGTKIFGKREP